MLIPKQHFIRDKNHLRFVASLPCCVTGAIGETQAAHIRIKEQAGLGRKPSDAMTLPMHYMAHKTQHEQGESEYWGDRLDKAKQLARDLYAVSGQTDEALRLISEFRSEK